jgi:hypothetical protein
MLLLQGEHESGPYYQQGQTSAAATHRGEQHPLLASARLAFNNYETIGEENEESEQE